jgi:hypothetical protein
MPVTAPVSLTKIKAEFSGPDNFAAYVRNGSYVPSYPANAGISTSVNGLAMSTFLNASDTPPVSLPSWNSDLLYDNNIGSSFFDSTCEGATSEIFLYMNSNGTIVYNDMLANTSHTWLPSGTASDYYFRFDIDTGGITNALIDGVPVSVGSVTGTNLQMSSSYVFGIQVSVSCGDSQSLECTGTWSIRDASNNILVSKTFAMGTTATSSD